LAPQDAIDTQSLRARALDLVTIGAGTSLFIENAMKAATLHTEGVREPPRIVLEELLDACPGDPRASGCDQHGFHLDDEAAVL